MDISQEKLFSCILDIFLFVQKKKTPLFYFLFFLSVCKKSQIA